MLAYLLERNPECLVIEGLVRSAGEQFSRCDEGGFLDQVGIRQAYRSLFRRLEKSGFGRFMLGRKGHKTRFELNAKQAEWLKATLQEIGVTVIDELEQPPEVLDDRGLPVQRKAAVRPNRDTVLTQLKAHHSDIEAFGVRSLAIFGSIARDEAKPDSDVDLLVTFKDAVTSDAFFGLKFFLEDLLGLRIDLVTPAAMREPIRQAIEPELLRVA